MEEKKKRELIDLILIEDTSKTIFSKKQKEYLIDWIITGKKPDLPRTTKFRTFYTAYHQLRKTKKILALLEELRLM